jgi:hypothetical protein
MGVAERIALLVAHGFEKLVYPNRGVDSEALPIERRKVGRPRAWLHDGPETVHAHGG